MDGNYPENFIKKNFTEGKWVEILFSFVLVFHCCLLGINSITNAFIGSTSLDSILLCLLLVMVVAFSIIPIIKQANIKHYLFSIIVVSVFFISSIFSTECFSRLITFFLTVFPTFFVGATLKDIKSAEKYMYKASIVGLICALAYIVFNVFDASKTVHEMVPSYSFLACAVFLLYYSMKYRKIYNYIFAILSFVAIVVFSVRGPIIVYLVCFAILLFQNVKVNRPLKIMILLIVLLPIIFVCTNYFDSFIELLDSLFNKIGVTSGLVKRLSEGNFLDSNGRDSIAANLINSVWEHPFLGTGLFSDREMVGTYAHNLFLELLVDFGIVFGAILIAAIAFNVIKMLYTNRKNNCAFGLLITVMSVAIGKLMFSGSYLESSEFFMLLGMMMNPVFNKSIFPFSDSISKIHRNVKGNKTV